MEKENKSIVKGSFSCSFPDFEDSVFLGVTSKVDSRNSHYYIKVVYTLHIIWLPILSWVKIIK